MCRQNIGLLAYIYTTLGQHNSAEDQFCSIGLLVPYVAARFRPITAMDTLRWTVAVCVRNYCMLKLFAITTSRQLQQLAAHLLHTAISARYCMVQLSIKKVNLNSAYHALSLKRSNMDRV